MGDIAKIYMWSNVKRQNYKNIKDKFREIYDKVMSYVCSSGVTEREERKVALKATFAEIISENFLVLMKNINLLNQEFQIIPSKSNFKNSTINKPLGKLGSRYGMILKYTQNKERYSKK